jgi:phosphate uptake regulator
VEVSKSLGVLTLDLVAKTGNFVEGMTKAERASDKWRKNVQKNAAMAGKAMVALSGAAATALTAMTVQTVRAAGEITRLSQVAGTSTQEFQRYSAGANAMGIQQEKLADIFKDTSDKVGDFLQTGGGALADFFENIAPKVGVTAEQFRDLSGPQALGLYVSSLEKANVSQNEMTFFMEAIASDATLLLPLLKNNAEGFTLFGDAAERAGAILSEDIIRQSQELRASMFLLTQQFDGAKIKLSSALIPILNDFVDVLSTTTTDGVILDGVIEDISATFKFMAASAMGAFASISILGSGLKTLYNMRQSATEGLSWWEQLIPPRIAYNIYENWQEISNEFDKGTEDLETKVQRYATILDSMWSAGERGPRSDMAARLAEIMSMSGVETGGSSRTGVDKEADEAAKAAERLAKAVADQVAELQFQSAYVHKSAEEMTLLRLAADGATESQLALAESALANIAAFNAQAEEMKRINSEAMGIAESLQTEEEAIRSSYERRREIILKNTEITGKAQQNLLLRLENETNEKLEELNRGFWGDYLASLEENFANMDTLTADMLNNLTSGFGNAFEAMVFDAESLEDAVYKLASGMLRSIVNALGQMAGQWIAYQAVQLAMGQSTQAAVAATSAATGTAIASAYAPAAAMASLASFGANSAPAMAGITATASLAKGLSLVGMAHDGIDSVPQTGTWLLQKGERVTTADTSAKLDKTLSGLQSGMSGGMGKNIRIVNAWDTSMIGDYMGSSSGEEVIMNAVRRNQRTIRSLAR